MKLPSAERLHALIPRGKRVEAGCILGLCALVTLVLPLGSQAVPESSALHVPDFLITLVGKFTCYAMVALAADLAWGFVGILSLCHGLFFALGGYAIGMYLMREIGGEGMYRSELPDFMVFLDWKELPWYWLGFNHFAFALLMAILVPAFLAYAFGFFAFRSRIKGVYFSVITQALTFAAMLLFFRNATGFGGNNGLTDFKRILGHSLRDSGTRATLCALSGVALAGCYLVCRAVVASRAGRVLAAVRDAEAKVRFTGYDPVSYKLFAWTLSAAICGLAGALYVPQIGIINPSEMQPSNSIEIAIWVAVGGRGTLGGAVLGAFAVNAAKSWLTVAYPTAWLFALGALFIVVTLLVPGGIFQAAAAIPKAPALVRRLVLRARQARDAGRSPPRPPQAAKAPAESK